MVVMSQEPSQENPNELTAGSFPHKMNFAQRTALVLLAGLALGVLTLLGQGILPGSWNHFANSGAVWLLGAFLIGALMPAYAWAAAAGVLALIGALIGYSIAARALGFEYPLFYVAFWSGVSVVGGPVFGLAGYAWRFGSLRRRIIGLALLGAVFAAEGWFIIQYNQDLLAGSLFIMIGVLLALFLAGSARERLYTVLLMLPLTGLGMGVYALISWLTEIRIM
jgi:hypothetical protein